MTKKSSRAEGEEKVDEHRQIVPVPADDELFEFLESLFHLRDSRAQQPGVPGPPDAMPERIKLCAVFGVGGRDHGPSLMHEDWKPTSSPLPTREALVIFCNKLRARAARDCTILGKPQRYAVLAYSHLKGTEAYERFLMALRPGPKEYTEKDAAPTEEETNSSTTMRLLEMSMDHQRWMAEQFSEAIGSVMARQDQTIENLTRSLAESYKEHREVIKLREDLADRSVEREEKRADMEMKSRLADAGINMLQNLMPGIAALLTKGAVGGDVAINKFIQSLRPEQRDKLFGVWSEEGARTEPGILSLEQVEVVCAIATGQSPPARIKDVFATFSQEQIAEVQSTLTREQLIALLALNATLGASAKPSATANGATS